MIVFVTHFQKLKTEEKESIQQLCIEFSEKDPDIYIKCLFESCRLFHPDCRFFLLTDQTSSFSLPKDIEIVRFGLDRFKLRYSETVAQFTFLQKFEETDPIVLIDFDMLVQANLEVLFKPGHDVFLTIRKYPPWIPVNMGVAFINKGRASKASELFNVILGYMLAMPEEKLIWGGSQLAIWNIIREQYFNLTPLHRDLIVHGIDIGLLNADVYNFSTESVTMDGYYPEKKLLHFKGARKHYMPLYYEKYLVPHDLNS